MLSKLGSIFFSLRTKTTALILIFVAVLMSIVIGLIDREAGRVILIESLEKGISVATGLASSSEEPILTNDDLSLFASVKGITDNRGIIYGMIVDRNRKVIAHNDISQSGQDYREPQGIATLKEGPRYRIISYNSSTGIIYDISVPVVYRRLGEKIGQAHVGISKSIIDEAIEGVTRYIRYLTFISLLIGGLGAFSLTTLMVKPIKVLVDGTRAIRKGDFEQRLRSRRRDEVGELMKAFNEMADGLKEREFIRNTFKKFVHKDIVDEILRDHTKIKVGGERKKVTVLFADIRKFTHISESSEPEEIVQLLNQYFTTAIDIIDRNDGIVDKFIGDSVMAVFGVPFPKRDDSLRAVRTALMIREAVRAMNEKRARAGRFIYHIGIGVNTGYAVAGNVGSEDRMEYTVLGNTVNVAARVEGLAVPDAILITEDTYQEVKDFVITGAKEEVSLKGKSGTVGIYSVEGLK